MNEIFIVEAVLAIAALIGLFHIGVIAVAIVGAITDDEFLQNVVYALFGLCALFCVVRIIHSFWHIPMPFLDYVLGEMHRQKAK